MNKRSGTLLLAAAMVSLVLRPGTPSTPPTRTTQQATIQTSASNEAAPEADEQNSHRDLYSLDSDLTCKNKNIRFCPSDGLMDTIGAFYGEEANLATESKSSICGPEPAEAKAQERRSRNGKDNANPAGTMGHLNVPWCKREGVRFVIATVPDPLHTHLSLQFDREIEAIEQAAQASGYHYLFARAFLPWDNKEFPPSTDFQRRLAQEEYESSKEDIPGLMIFRRPPDDREPTDSAPLFVFLVRETPTGGIRKKQFHNAVLAIRAIRTDIARTTTPMEVFRILGPLFSGSLPSLSEILKTEDLAGFSSVEVHSGTVTNWKLLQWFACLPQKQRMISFISFQENDAFVQDLLIQSIPKKFGDGTIALLSEDETAYGAGDPSPIPNPEGRNVLHVYFPREISQLRNAYQRVIWGGDSTASRSYAQPRTSLSLSLEDNGGEEDTVPPYAVSQTPLSQESVLQGIVSLFQKRDVHFVVILATDRLDEIFLSRYLVNAYPRARIITTTADLIYDREARDPRMDGILVATPYPLLPVRKGYFAQPGDYGNGELIFPDSSSVGIFNAMLSLVEVQGGEAPTNSCPPASQNGPLKDLPPAPYAQYGWPQWPGSSAEPKPYAPPLWLVALGRGGYWPVSLLVSEKVRGFGSTSLHAIDVPAASASFTQKPPLDSAPVSWIALNAFLVVLVLEFSYMITFGSIFSSTDAMARFAYAGAKFNRAVIGIVGMILFSLLLAAVWPWTLWREQVGSVWWLCASSLTILVLFLACRDRFRGDRSRMVFTVCCSLAMAIAGTLFLFGASLGRAPDTYFLLTRYEAIASGLSPLVPFLFLAAAGLWWCWFALAGSAFVGGRAPVLPSYSPPAPDGQRGGHKPSQRFPFFSVCLERNRRLIKILRITSSEWRIYVAPCAVTATAVIATFASHNLPGVRSLEGEWYSYAYAILLGFLLFWTLCLTSKMVIVWKEFRRLLLALDLLPLRRSFTLLKGISWKPIWSFGGSGLQDSYRLLSREIEVLTYLKNAEPGSVQLQDTITTTLDTVEKELAEIRELVLQSKEERLRDKWEHFRRRHELSAKEMTRFERLQALRTALASVSREAFFFLDARWHEEKWFGAFGKADLSEAAENSAVAQLPDDVRLTEQFVCSVYLNFMQSVLQRLRTMVISLGGLYVFLLLSVSSYPFLPRVTLDLVMIGLFLIVAGSVALVYAEMHRDTILSLITHTTPGSLGADFYLKLASFIAVPLFSLVASHFPEINNFLFSWLQPAMNAFTR